MITLNNKDADWIANVARNELKDLQEAQETVLKEIAELEEKAKDLLEKHPEWPEEFQDKLAEAKRKSMQANQEYLNKETSKWQRIIELMMVGSEK